ncbi:pilus assembly protein PilM [Metabacillus sp. GX 13764]|uniref:pilus assembly protein PilM n=1 Tax=Metabacillus kandeliae TaxID=2900151 RepID=UPI001E45F40A|nr:pilus assembly protein PilM [Metabacillus kandeliae]MCD7032731.1 pilus assembly protein PilM [Metabacillus kandeliae]
MEGEQITFALDIGTRTVVGLMLREQAEGYEVLDMIVEEHSERAMLDGQIHDVLEVAKVIKSIKEKLEASYGTLKKVCVAAAGRALKTERAVLEMDIKGKPIFQKEDVLHMELMAVQNAQNQLASSQKEDMLNRYDCVGYSVVCYQLDGQDIGSLIDQQGDKASVEIIATFLPKVVVESLLAALARADLEMEALTLEPIAAISVLIPPSMRRLNVALVDIGAGTSDIAITDSGTITAFGMVPIAGDEITEAVSDEFLLDFPLAEKAKRELQTESHITVTDILGFEEQLSKEEAVERILPSIKKLAEAIKEEIFLLNSHHSPKAVMLIGGGSLTPELPKILAELLGLPENRVAIRGLDAIAKLQKKELLAAGPELVTPIGIAIASRQSPIQYIHAFVNDRLVRMFQMKKLTVADCLLSAGIPFSKMYGKPGLAAIVEVNGQRISIPGKHGEPPALYKNGQPAGLEEELAHGDRLTVEQGHDGSSPEVYIKDLLDAEISRIYHVNGKEEMILPEILVNGAPAVPSERLQDRDRLSFRYPETMAELVEWLQKEEMMERVQPFIVTVNEKEHEAAEFSGRLLKNGLPALKSSKISPGDSIDVVPYKAPRLHELADALGLELVKRMDVYFNGTEAALEKQAAAVYRDDIQLRPEQTIQLGDHLSYQSKEVTDFIFQDVFVYADSSISRASGTSFTLLKNGQPAGFADPLNSGDQLVLTFN